MTVLREIIYVLNGVMIYGYEWLLVAIVAIIIADVRPLVAVTGPYLTPAPAVGGIVVIVRPSPEFEKWRTKERKVAETVMPEEKAVIPIEAAKSPFEAVLPTIEAAKSAKAVIPIKAASTGDEPAPAAEHRPMETATEMHATEPAAAEMHSTATEPAVHSTAAEPAVHSAAAEPAVHSAATEPATRQGWRWKGDCRPEHGRGHTTEDIAFHHSDPPTKEFMLVAGRRRRGHGSRRQLTLVRIRINNQSKIFK
ncbi:MAG: hypothetical protein ACREDH_15195 [Methylocella sp.]